MKKALLILAAICTLGIARAADEPPQPPPHGGEDRPAANANRPRGQRPPRNPKGLLRGVARQYDANHNGKLDPEERAKLLADLDAIGDLGPQRPPRDGKRPQGRREGEGMRRGGEGKPGPEGEARGGKRGKRPPRAPEEE